MILLVASVSQQCTRLPTNLCAACLISFADVSLVRSTFLPLLVEQQNVTCTILASLCCWLFETKALLMFYPFLQNHCACDADATRNLYSSVTVLTCRMRAFLACCAGIAKPASSCRSGSIPSVIEDHAQSSMPSSSTRKRLAVMTLAAGAHAARQ